MPNIKRVNDINLASLSWTDPEANMVLSDKSTIVKSFKSRQKRVFVVRNKREFDQKKFFLIH